VVERNDVAEADVEALPCLGDVMVEDKLKQAEAFGDRADRLRLIAQDLAHEEERKLLLQIAVEYEQLAHSAVNVAMTEIARVTGSD